MSKRDKLIAALAREPEMDAFLEAHSGLEVMEAVKALLGRSPAEPSLYDTSGFKVWRRDVDRDDWMSRFTSVDIRIMLNEIEHLSAVPASDAFLDNEAAMIGLSASDAAAHKWPEDTELHRESRAASVAGAIAYAAPQMAGRGSIAMRGLEAALRGMENAHSLMTSGRFRDSLYNEIVNARTAIRSEKDAAIDHDSTPQAVRNATIEECALLMDSLPFTVGAEKIRELAATDGSPWSDIADHSETEFGRPVRRLVHGSRVGIREADVTCHAGLGTHVSIYGLHGDAVRYWGVTKYRPMPLPPGS
jgi:hypothetical protein